MKALTVSQPYADLLVDGLKWVENRSRNFNFRGRIAIHAGKGNQYLTAEQMKKFATGAVIGFVDVVECVQLDLVEAGEVSHRAKLNKLGINREEFLDHEHTHGPYCLIIRNPRRIEPIPARGMLGLWEWEGSET